MCIATRSLHVDAAAEQVWEYLRTPANMTEWWPDCEEIHDVARSDDGAVRFKWTDKPAGVVCHGETAETLEEPEKRLRLHLTGDLCGDLRWAVQDENGGSRLTFESDYDLPVRSLVPYLSAVRILNFQRDEADAVIRRVREHFSTRSG
jgi:uncharacterized protein YndB with AHSA1/START domain